MHCLTSQLKCLVLVFEEEAAVTGGPPWKDGLERQGTEWRNRLEDGDGHGNIAVPGVPHISIGM